MKTRPIYALFAASMTSLLLLARTTPAQEETIHLLTPEGQGTVTLECSCSHAPFVGCAIGHRVDKEAVFVLPRGYKKGQFSSEVQPGGVHSGGRATWLTDDPHDARINLHCWADAFSNAKVIVSGVTATRE